MLTMYPKAMQYYGFYLAIVAYRQLLTKIIMNTLNSGRLEKPKNVYYTHILWTIVS